MWIVPAACEVTPLWETVGEDVFFAVQRSLADARPSLWSTVLGTLQAMFDVKQAPFRILLKTAAADVVAGDGALCVAVASSRREIDADWRWLHEHVVPALGGHARADAVRLACAQIERLLGDAVAGTDEAAADEKFRATARAFRHTFALPDTERLVSCYSCSVGGALVSQGWLYLSEHHLAYYSYVMGVETKILVELKNVVEIRKERSKNNLVPDSVFVATSDRRELLFSNLFRRDEVYDLLQSLLNRALHRTLQTTAPPTAPGTDRSPASAAPAAAGAPTLREGLERQKREALIGGLFNVPAGEELLEQIWTVLWTENSPDQILRGELFLTSRFLLFASHSPAGSRLVLPAPAVRRMEKVYSEHARSSRDDPYTLAITTCHHQRIYLTVGSTVRQCDRLTFRLKQVLLASVALSKALLPFLATLPSEQLMLGEEACQTVTAGFGAAFGYPLSDPKREAVLLEHWAVFFASHGRSLAMLRTPYFDRLVRAGLPNRLRGEVWEISSGSVYNRFLHPDLYEQTLSLHADRHSLALEEIEKDLNRHAAPRPSNLPQEPPRVPRLPAARGDRRPPQGPLRLRLARPRPRLLPGHEHPRLRPPHPRLRGAVLLAAQAPLRPRPARLLQHHHVRRRPRPAGL